MALERLKRDLPPALVMADLLNPLALSRLPVPPSALRSALLIRLEGEAEAVARGFRAAWQAVELAGGEPLAFERRWGAWAWGPVLPDLAGRHLMLVRGQPEDLAALVALADEAGAPHLALGLRLHVLAGAGWLDLAEAAPPPWLLAAARDLQLRLEARSPDPGEDAP
jgi:hypothetical protein